MVSTLNRKLRRDIRRHRAQFIAVAVTVFLGVTMFVASYDSYLNLDASYQATFTEYRFANVTYVGGDVETLAGSVAVVEGVESVAVRTVADHPLQIGGVKMLGRVVGVPADRQADVNQLKVLEGSYLGVGDSVLVEEHMANHFDLSPGESIDVLAGDNWVSAEVAGIVSSPEYIWPSRSRQELITTPDNFGVIFTTEETAQKFTESGPNELAVYFDGGAENDGLLEQLAPTATAAGVAADYTRAEQPSNAALSEDIKGFEEMAGFFPLLFLTAAGLASYVMISRLVHAQRPHIGAMLANGMTKGKVLRHYLGYGVVPGVVAAVPGAIAGALLARVITTFYTGLLSVPVTLIEFYPINAVGGILFGVGAAFLAALAPALVASRIRPAEAMRGETPTGGGQISLLERIIPPLRRLPIRWRMPLRGIGRNPRRTIYTVVGVVLSLMLVLVSWGMIDTVNYLMNTQFVDIQQEDATVYFIGPVAPAEVAALTGLDGIDSVETSLQVPVTLVAGVEDYDTALVALASNTQMHRFLSVNGDWLDLGSEGVLVGKAVADLLGVEVGDPLEVQVGAIGASFTDEIAGFLDEPLGTLAYISTERVEGLVGSRLPATSALIRYEEGFEGSDLRPAITALPGVAAFNDSKAMFDMMQQFMLLFYAFVGVMLVFGGAMAFALIFNAMSVNIAERRREVATLLAVGTDRRTISRLITTENLIVAIMGIPIGLLAGYYLSKAAMGTFSSDMFSFDLYVKPMTFVWASLAIVVVALVSQIPGLRAIRRISIPEVIKERAA
ncbi:MAG: FtsX-like permease family protein [Acidimicrobiia bacterium]|nr:FtsX-like permease family protein [Acidimicrobiia bacterium]